MQNAVLPDLLSLHTVCLGPDPVVRAWTARRRGGQFDWRALDRALAAFKSRRVAVVLVLPVPTLPDDHWEEFVAETVRHVNGQVALFEFRAEPGADVATYLKFYEAGVWAAYQVDSRIHVGGPGLSLQDAGVEALIKHCAAYKVPLHSVTWHVPMTAPNDILRSVDRVEKWVSQYPLASHPESMITGWQVQSDGEGDALAMALSGLMTTMTANIRALCLADTADVVGWTAVRVLDSMTGVRVPMVIQAPNGDVLGGANLAFDTVQALFWHRQSEGAALVKAMFNGLPWGDRIRIEQLRLTMETGEWVLMSSETRAFQEPLPFDFDLQGNGVTAIRLVIE